MLTPLDIHNKEFKKSLRGYDMEVVDEFLDEVIKDFETLYKENLELKEKLQSQQENLNRYKEIEETLQSTMVLAQKMSEEAKRNADKEVELILSEAHKRAEQIVSSAHAEVLESTRKIEKLNTFKKQMEIKLRHFLQLQLEMLEDSQEHAEVTELFREQKEQPNEDFIECPRD